MQSTSVLLPDDIGEQLTFLEKQTGRSKASYIVEALRRQLDDLEDIHIAEQRLSDMRAGRSTACSLEEVERRLELGD